VGALDFAAFRAAPLVRQPFEHLVLPGFVKPEARVAINAAYPRIDTPGSFPVCELSYGPAFAALLDTLSGAEFRQAVEAKFALSLEGRPTVITVRGRCGTKDGNIHTDQESKIITVLIYMNPEWGSAGGCLRLLRSGTDIDDVITEIPPLDGTLVAFRRSDNSWHGHKPFIGERRVIQLNWVKSEGVKVYEVLRHRASAWIKKLRGIRGQGSGVRDQGSTEIHS
jgi:SM-20-related protein